MPTTRLSLESLQMVKFIMLIGPPGSGKSTWAREHCRGRVIRINRDELRTMFKGEYVHGDSLAEYLCTKATLSIASDAMNEGADVILDNTNCTLDTVKDIINRVGHRENVELVFKVFDVPYRTQRWRCLKRFMMGKGPWIPKRVSQRMHMTFQEVKAHIDEYNRGRVTG